MNDKKQLDLIFQELCNYIGLHDFKVVYQSMSNDSIVINLSKILSYPDIKLGSVGHFAEKIVDPIIKSVENSAAVTSAKNELMKQNIELLEKLKNIEIEINRLKEFEIYYNLAHKMAHK